MELTVYLMGLAVTSTVLRSIVGPDQTGIIGMCALLWPLVWIIALFGTAIFVAGWIGEKIVENVPTL